MHDLLYLLVTRTLDSRVMNDQVNSIRYGTNSTNAADPETNVVTSDPFAFLYICRANLLLAQMNNQVMIRLHELAIACNGGSNPAPHVRSLF